MQNIHNTKFIKYGYDSFITEWHNYYKNNYLTFFEEVEQLKQDLNNESKNFIDQFINTLIYKLATPSYQYLIKKDYLYSQEELKLIKKETLNENEINLIKKQYKINPNFSLQVSVFKYHNGLKKLPKHILKTIHDNIVLDCGAYYGDSSLIFTKYRPKKVYSFEPNSINFSYLEKTVKNNNLDNYIIPINKGVYSKNINTLMQFNSLTNPNLGAKLIKPSSKYLKKTKYKQEIIQLTTIDNFVISNQLKDISLIKLDIEGVSLDALIGAKNTIKKYKPILLIAIYHNAEEFLYAKPFIEHLSNTYKFFMFPLDTKDILKEFYLIAYNE